MEVTMDKKEKKSLPEPRTYTQQATPLASDTMSAILLNAFLQKKHFLIIFYLKRVLFERPKTLNLNFYDSFFVFS